MAVIKQITLVLPVSKLMAMIVKLSPKYRREFLSDSVEDEDDDYKSMPQPEDYSNIELLDVLN